jgi:hypothetical protein
MYVLESAESSTTIQSNTHGLYTVTGTFSKKSYEEEEEIFIATRTWKVPLSVVKFFLLSSRGYRDRC